MPFRININENVVVKNGPPFGNHEICRHCTYYDSKVLITPSVKLNVIMIVEIDTRVVDKLISDRG